MNNRASLQLGGGNWAAKDGNLLAYETDLSEKNFLPIELGFERGSNLAATRVNSSGLIEKGRENLLRRSNQFDTTPWASSATLTSGQSGYDGSNDAWLLTKTSSGAQSVYNYINETGVMTMSVYAKAGSTNWMRLTQGGKTAYFDLSGSGAVGTSSNGIDQTITSVGNGWFRCTLTANKTTAGQTPIYPYTAEGDASGSTDSIYIQDSQFEQGLVATEYIESGATTGLAGILEDSPRFDYSGGASCPSLLLEPSRTQIVRQSEYIDGYSAKIQCTTTPNYGTSPEGLVNSTRLEFTANGYIHEGVPQVIGTEYTISVYAKRNDSGTQSFGFFVDGSGTIDSEITLTSEWQRFDYTYTASNIYYFGLAGNSGADVSVFGLQVEEGSYPTSYIPNHSGGSVTRSADVNTLLNQSGVIGQTAGTILFDAYFDEAEKVNFSISDSSVSNFISIETTSSNEVTAKVEQGGSTQATITTTTSFFAEGDRLKCAIAYDDRDMAFYINGTQVNTAAPNLIPACDDVRFGNYDGSIKADQRVNRVLLFDTRISNGNLATLTS